MSLTNLKLFLNLSFFQGSIYSTISSDNRYKFFFPSLCKLVIARRKFVDSCTFIFTPPGDWTAVYRAIIAWHILGKTSPCSKYQKVTKTKEKFRRTLLNSLFTSKTQLRFHHIITIYKTPAPKRTGSSENFETIS